MRGNDRFAVAAPSEASAKRGVFSVACFAAFIFSLLVGIDATLVQSEALAQPAATCKTPAVRASITDLKARIDRYRHRINVLDSEIRPLEKLLDEQTKAAFKKNGTDHDDNTVQTYYKLSRKRIDREQLDKTLDRLIDELDKLESLPDCKVEAPPEVKLYHVGTRYKPEPEVRQDIGSTIKPFHPFFALAVGGDRSKTNFDVEPPFDVNGSGFVFAISGGGLFDIPGTPTSVGARIGWLGGNTTGSIENPSTGFLYDVKRSSAFYQEALLQFSINPEILQKPLMRLCAAICRQKRPHTFVFAPKAVAGLKASKNRLSRDFRRSSIFDFCNSICQ